MYAWLFRAFLSRMDPERAHRLASIAIRVAGWRAVAWAARATTRPAPSLAVETMGLRFSSPFGVAAGFDKQTAANRGATGALLRPEPLLTPLRRAST